MTMTIVPTKWRANEHFFRGWAPTRYMDVSLNGGNPKSSIKK